MSELHSGRRYALSTMSKILHIMWCSSITYIYLFNTKPLNRSINNQYLRCLIKTLSVVINSENLNTLLCSEPCIISLLLEDYLEQLHTLKNPANARLIQWITITSSTITGICHTPYIQSSGLSILINTLGELFNLKMRVTRFDEC